VQAGGLNECASIGDTGKDTPIPRLTSAIEPLYSLLVSLNHETLDLETAVIFGPDTFGQLSSSFVRSTRQSGMIRRIFEF
jgi:hypothetical protein